MRDAGLFLCQPQFEFAGQEGLDLGFDLLNPNPTAIPDRDPIIGVAAQQCLTPTVGLDDFVKPEVQGLVQIPICQDG